MDAKILHANVFTKEIIETIKYTQKSDAFVYTGGITWLEEKERTVEELVVEHPSWAIWLYNHKFAMLFTEEQIDYLCLQKPTLFIEMLHDQIMLTDNQVRMLHKSAPDLALFWLKDRLLLLQKKES